MSDTDLSIFADEPAEAVEAPVQEQVQEQPEAVPEPEAEADPSPEAKASETGEQEATPPVAEPEPEKTQVPITAMLDEREKRQEIQRQFEAQKAETERLKRQFQEMQAQKQQPAPDWIGDPDAAARQQQAAIQQQIVAQKLQTSKFMAEREFGAEAVKEAYDYFEANPHLSHQFMNEPSPFHAAVEFYKRQKFLEEVKDPDEWREQERERIRQELAAQQPVQPQPSPTPPASLSSAGPSGQTNAVAVDVPKRMNGLFNG